MRVLLLEFAALGRFHRGFQLPFLKGYLKVRHVDVRWIRFGLDPDVRSRVGETGMSLEDADLSRLEQILGEWDCTHVVCSRAPSCTVLGTIRRVLPQVRVGHVLDGPQVGMTESGGSEPVNMDPSTLDRFLGMTHTAGASAPIVETEVPDFGWEAANRAAATEQPLPFLLCGTECDYRKTLASNPLYDNLDLSGCHRKDGCAFCVRPPEDRRPAVDSVALFRRQLEALARTHPGWRGRLAVRAVGVPILRNIEAIAQALCDCPVGPVDLLLDGRADRILKVQDSLRRALDRVGGSKHALHLCLLGIESFSDEELALLNKGTTSEQNCRAAQLLIALERDHPGSFEFQKYGGFSLLLFTPWTRLENLALNLAIIRRCRLADYCGKLFTSRLRLYPSLPMYPMALRDGLVLERYEDPRLDTARRNFYDDEVPWKFASSPMEVVCSLLLRLQDAPGSTDPLASSLAALMPRHPHTGHMLALAEALVDEALSHPSASAEEIVASVQRSVTNPVEGIGQPSEREGVGPRDGEPMPPLLIALSGGLKPVARLEGADVEARGWSDDVLRRVASVVQQRLPFSDVAGPPEVFVGRDRNAVMRAIELTDRMERAEDDAEWQDAAAEVGVLLGYPACCSQAFAKRPPSVRKSYMWLYVQSRLDHPGPVDPLLNPGPEHVINYVPCSLGCQPTRALARRMVDLLRERSSTREFERLVQACAHPWLLFVDQQGDAVELVTDHEPSGRFPYHAGLARGSNPLIPRIVEGDELEIGSQHALVFRKGSLIASLGGRAFVWWHRAPVQESLWRSMLALRFEPRRPALQGARDAGGTPGPDAQKIAKLLDQLLGLSSGREIDFLGFRVRSITPEREDQVRIELRHQNVTLVLMATPAAKDTPAYAHAGPLALYHPRDAKIDTRRKQLATQKLTAYLVQAFRQPPTRSDLRDPTPSEP